MCYFTQPNVCPNTDAVSADIASMQYRNLARVIRLLEHPRACVRHL
jgi:hypothetical protein